MDHVRIEMLAPVLREEARREAERARLAAAAAPAAGHWIAFVAGTGRLLVRAGERLKAVECRRPVGIPAGVVSEACGCAE